MPPVNPNRNAPSVGTARCAAARIIERRREADACDLHKLSDDLAELLGYLVAHERLPERRRVPRVCRQADAADAWIIARHLAAQRYQRGAAEARDILAMARAAGMSRLAVGRLIGARTKQAGHRAPDRYAAAAAGHPGASVADHRPGLADQGRADRRRAAAASVAGHEADRRATLAGPLRQLCGSVVRLVDRVPPDHREDVGDIAAALGLWRDGEPCPAELLDDLRILIIVLRRVPDLDSELRTVLMNGAQLVDQARAT